MTQSVIYSAVEGEVDEAVVRHLLECLGGVVLGGVFGKKGKAAIRQKLNGLNRAAQNIPPWFVLIDLDRDYTCAPDLLREWLPRPSSFMCFRVAVRAVESWLLADREHIAQFLQVSEKKVPIHPENLNDPKQEIIKLAMQSRDHDIREDIVPRKGSKIKIGPLYNDRLREFVTHPKIGWRPEAAAKHSDSLKRCLQAIKRMKEKGSYG